MNSNEETEDICVLCCREIKIFATGKCDHPVCYECSTRMRVLCDQKECPICRSNMPVVLFTHYEQLYTTLGRSHPLMNKKYMIVFEDKNIQDAFERLLEHKCRICDELFRTFKMLRDHMRRKHELQYCDLCVNNLKIFPFEKKSYSRSDLVRHRRIGDPDETSHRGHPLCEYCDERYVDSDELFRHLRRDHFFCHFCDADGKHQYYRDYSYLKTHFRKEHYLCEEEGCAEEKFIGAFRTSIDFQAHKALHHTRNKSKAEVKQARTLDVEFTIAPRNFSNGGSPQQNDSRYSRYSRQNQQRKRNIDDNTNRENFISFDDSDFQRFPPRENVKQEIDMGSVQEFPHLPGGLDSNGASNFKQPENPANLFLHSYGRQAGKINGVIKTEEFPALGSASPSSQISSKFSQDSFQNSKKFANVNLSNRQVSSWVKPKPQVFSSHENVRNPQDMIKKAIFSQKVNMNIRKMPQFQVESSDFEHSYAKNAPPTWVSPKKTSTFEENFPKLASKSKGVVALYSQPVPTEVAPVVEPPSQKESPVFQLAAKPKSKKKKAKQASANDENDDRTFIPNVEKDSILCTLNEENTEDKEKIENQENEDPSKTMVQVVKDLVSPSAVKEEKHASDNVSDYQSINLLSEDFPPLPTIDVCAKVPPGFIANQKFPPPGFSAKPPMFGASTIINMSLSSVAQQLTLSNKDNCLKTAKENTDSTGLLKCKQVHGYQQPPNFHKRNNELPKQILNSVNGQQHLFDDFKSISGQFRNGSICAADYYSKCLDILGKDGLLTIIAELIALLPDISKQQQLLTVHNNFVEKESKMQGAVPKRNGQSNDNSKIQLVACTVCQQVVMKEDYKSHQDDHEFELHKSSS